MAFYGESFTGNGKTRATWEADKKVVFDKHEDVKVTTHGLTILKENDVELEVQFFQTYKSFSYCDITQKNMVLKKYDSYYKIVEEGAIPYSETPVPCEEIDAIKRSLEAN